jgi:MFS transporter, DHA3 family, macrolide efflux protein
VSGLSNPLINGPFFAILQAAVAPEIQGRVFTAMQSLAGLAAPLGMVIAGPLADSLGVQVWFLIGGVISLMMGVGLRFVPSVMHLEDHAVASDHRVADRRVPTNPLPTEEKGVSTPDITRSQEVR